MSCNDCSRDTCTACQRPRHAPIRQLVQAVPFATRIVVTGESSALTTNATGDQIIDWKGQNGWVVGISGAVTRLGSTDSIQLAIADAAFSLRTDGADEKPLVTDGTARSFASFAIFGLDLCRVYPVVLPVRSDENWLANFVSRAGLGQQVQLLFHFVRDKDLQGIGC